MLNMLDTQDKLKNFSEQQLVQEMQRPTGSAPQFMVLGEIERRKRMRADTQRQEGLMQATVAQEAVSAAGVPQQGIAQVAQSLAPQTDMTQNTGVPNVQAAGLPAQPNQPVKMNTGGRLTLLHTDPVTINMASRMGMSVDDYISSLDPKVLEHNLRQVTRRKANEGLVFDNIFDPERPVYEQVDPLQLEETFEQLKENIRDEEVKAMGVNPSFNTDTRDRAFGIGISDRIGDPPSVGTAPTRPAEGLEVLRSMDVPALPQLVDTTTGNPVVDRLASNIPLMQTRLVKDKMLSGPDLAAGTTDNPAPSGTFADEELVMSRPVSVSRRPGFRPGDDTEVLGFGGQTIAELQSIIDNPESTTGEVEAAKTRLAAALGIESVLQATSNTLEATPDAAYTLARPTLDAMSDAYALTGRVGNKIVDATGRVVSLASPDAGAAILDMAANNESAYNRAATRFDPPETEEDMIARRLAEVDAAFPKDGEEAVMDQPVVSEPTVSEPTVSEPTVSEPAAGSKEEGIATVKANTPKGGTGSGGTSTAKKSGIDAAKGKMDQDKWLALAQAGFELMSSGDFGKAGKAGLASLQQAKANDMAQQKLDAELLLREAQMAAATRKGTTTKLAPASLVTAAASRLKTAADAASSAVTPAQKLAANDEYTLALQEYNNIQRFVASQYGYTGGSAGTPAGPADLSDSANKTK